MRRSRRARLRKRRQSLQVWARSVIRMRIRRLERALGLLERSPSPESIHFVRVSGRRLRAALRHLEPCFRADHVQQLRTSVRRAGSLLGEVRDLDILMENLSRDAARRGSPLALLMERLKDRRQRRLEGALPLARRLRLRLPGWRRRLEV